MDAAPFHADIAQAPAPAQVVWVRASDGLRLRLGLWGAGPRGMVALFTGRTEVIEKYGRVITDLVAAGYGVAIMDWRGQGLSDRLSRQPLLGDVPDFAHFQRDVAAFDHAIRAFAPDAPRYVLAHSMGGCIALRALINNFPARAAAFSAPMWGLPLGNILGGAVNVASRALGLGGWNLREVPGAGIEFRLWDNPFDTNDLTTDRDTYDWMQQQVIARPELRLGAPSLRWLAAALAECTALETLPSPAIPGYCGLGTRERIVSAHSIRARMQNWPNGQLQEFNGALHELLMEAPATRAPFMAQTLALFGQS
jgi:lysophospholipase